ncbi:hypothetical protein A2872_01430 [Candidatus Gottesmanbacteria bacterium RIFCSPHIGHO2_01_FULL_42_12]|uniref:AB hydrolase-1 domain-containing protein n=1 Tax=Candidatus Gottesmanbacteria bacterium RIFCSPHIGHO2_01_FULL_42_12 TaxID=1798377 RepID=A0A1F5Z473_9BACT|nr:MAG: hypothetical protein A2872_01430 [Candidatus Gottesmanbacteria bacterium RIFCSPHIGHO2_01_FULL_42_12]
MNVLEKYVETSRGKIWYLEMGSGKKTLLYLHGWMGTPERAITISHNLEKNGFKVIAPYLPGHGDSFKLVDGFTFNDLVSSMEEFFEELELSNIFAIGHSVGGAVIYELANTEAGYIKKAVIIDGYNNFRHVGAFKVALLVVKELFRKELFKTFFHLYTKPLAKKATASAVMKCDALIKTLCPSPFNPRNDQNIFLFIWGVNDELTPESEWLKATGISKDRVVNFPGGHCWCVIHLGKTWPTIEKFLYASS